MTELKDKSVHELRAIAQTFDIDNIFSMDAGQLAHAIEIKRVELIPEPEIELPKPHYDARLMTRPPSKKSKKDEILDLLDGHIKLGLRVEFIDEETWSMYRGDKTDTGSIRVPLRVMLKCADRMMK
jgi:hypothetical protein